MSNLLLDIFTSGIDFNLPGNGGPECLSHTSYGGRAIESTISLITFATAITAGLKGHVKPSITYSAERWKSSIVRICLLYSMLLTWVAEIGYKLVTRQFIFVVNPCHVLCMIHIYLLSNFHSQFIIFKTYLFRIHLFFLHGPLMAVIFPVTNTLFLAGEVATYWVEHVLLLTIPIFLLKHYSVPGKGLGELMNWSLMSYGIWGIYNFIFLQPLAMVTLGNLNSVLCPAITDPFRGPHYRVYALGHQLVATIVSGVFWCLFGKCDTISAKEDCNLNNIDDRNGNACEPHKNGNATKTK